MEFKSCINPYEKHKFSESGFKETIDIYEDVINEKTGKLETKKTRQENFYEKIQAMKESQELENIIKRYQIDLNENHITEISEEIVDMTNIPEDLIETYAVTKKLENMFNETTADIKAHFKDFAGFLRSFQNGTLTKELNELSTKRKVEEIPQENQMENQIKEVVKQQLEMIQQQKGDADNG